MTLSLIIPVRDRAALLAEALASVLSQSQPPDEIVVVDDASSDASASVASACDPRVRVIRRSQAGGPAAARNDGAGAATGDLLVFLDSDDLLAPGMIARQSAWLTLHPEHEVIYGGQVIFRGPPPPLPQPDPAAVVVPAAPVFHPGTFTIRRTAFDRVGALATTLAAGEWIDWFSRAQSAGLRFATEAALCLFRRVHAGNLTRELAVTAPGYHRLLAEHLRRARL
jgi:glycosyltransferase involved in cell wall biosynthesis